MNRTNEELVRENAELRRRLAAKQRPVLNLEEAVEYVGATSERAFGDWRRRWRVPCLNKGRFPRFAKEDLDRGLERQIREGRRAWTKGHGRKSRKSTTNGETV